MVDTKWSGDQLLQCVLLNFNYLIIQYYLIILFESYSISIDTPAEIHTCAHPLQNEQPKKNMLVSSRQFSENTNFGNFDAQVSAGSLPSWGGHFELRISRFAEYVPLKTCSETIHQR